MDILFIFQYSSAERKVTSTLYEYELYGAAWPLKKRIFILCKLKDVL